LYTKLKIYYYQTLKDVFEKFFFAQQMANQLEKQNKTREEML